jgi:phosphoribosyl 1,2-cyclic phosphate phosphodiesterase
MNFSLMPELADSVCVDHIFSMNQWSVTFLGTGTSTGVPVIGCSCAVCRSYDPRNNRTRSSIFIETDHTNLLVDSGPDLRIQALRENMKKVDAVLYTHSHMDHVVGFDELRAFCWARENRLPMYANAGCMKVLKIMFGWAFSEENIYQGYVKPEPIIFDREFFIKSIEVMPIPVLHGTVETSGFLFKMKGNPSIAYLPDVKVIPDKSLEFLIGCDVLIIDCLHYRKHSTHMNVEESLATIEKIKPQISYLTHLSHEVDHATLEATLPENIRIAYDGLKISY